MEKYYRLIIILLAFCYGNVWKIQAQAVSNVTNYSSRIVDAETGEALPFAQVYVSPSKGTLSNDEGEFSLTAAPDDSLRISYIGYEKLRFAAHELPEVVKMQKVARMLEEVTVVSSKGLLEKIARQLEADYKAHKRDESRYFMRQTIDVLEERQMVEAYLTARSSVNLRDIAFLSGKHFNNKGTYDPMSRSMQATMLQFSNLHRFLNLGPMIRDNKEWKSIITPFDKTHAYKSRYEHSAVLLKEKDGTEILKIKLSPDKNRYGQIILAGTLAVDHKTLEPLSFDGYLDNIWMEMYGKKYPATMDIHIRYDHKRGFTEVAHIATRLKSESGLDCRMMLYNTDGMDLPATGEKAKNMLTAIQRAGYDPKLWEEPIVKRTAGEEALTEQKPERKGHIREWDIPVDSLSSWALRADSIGTKYPQEMVFVHMDNSCYFLGDTLHYKAYVQRSDMSVPTDMSRLLYVELLNQDGYLVERQQVELKDGQGNGTFCLPDTLYAGYYEMRAYTRWQLNWGMHEHPHTVWANRWFLRKEFAEEYFRDYDKLYSRVFPVYDKPADADNPQKLMTLRPLQRAYKVDEERDKAEVRIYPEGGAWISGVRQRLAFEARDAEGMRLDGRLVIYDKKHHPVAEARTEHRGRGTVEMTHAAGETYKAEFIWSDGKVQKVELPKAETQGVAIRVEDKNTYFDVRMERSGMEQTTLALAVMANGKLQHYCKAAPTIQIPTDSLPEGVAQFTVYDTKGKVWADRLAFVRKPGTAAPTVRISGRAGQYTPLAPIHLKLKGPARGKVSVSVKDSDAADRTYDNGNILTEMLLASQIRGFVEQPGYYFEQDDEAHRRHLDLLLMVQGWRRFAWKDMTGGLKIHQPFEVTPILMGEVYDYSPIFPEEAFHSQYMGDCNLDELHSLSGGTSGPKLVEIPVIEDSANISSQFWADLIDSTIFSSTRADYRTYQSLKTLKEKAYIHAEFVQNGTDGISTDISTQKRFVLSTPRAYGRYYFHLAGSKKAKSQWVMPNADMYPDLNVRLIPYHPRFVKPYDYYQERLAEPEEQTSVFGEKRLREVTVRSRRRGYRTVDLNKPAFVMDAYEAYNAVVDAGMMTAWYAGNLSFSIAVTCMTVGEMGIKRSYDMERRWNGRDLTFMNLTRNEQHRCNHLENLDRIAVYTDYAPRLEGDKRYQATDQPKVIFDTRSYTDNTERPAYRDRFYIQPGYNIPEDFYHPDYSKFKLPEGTKDHRRTLYWHPDVTLDEHGEATVSLYNNSRTTHIAIEVNGQMEDGTLLWGHDGTNE